MNSGENSGKKIGIVLYDGKKNNKINWKECTVVKIRN